MRIILNLNQVFQKCVLLLIIIFISACSEDIIKIIPAPGEEEKIIIESPEVIKVSLRQSRIDYDDEGTSGVKQYWESGDQFILYSTTGDKITYTVSEISSSDASTATFTTTGTIKGAIFYAVYQNGSTIDVSFNSVTGEPTYSMTMTGQTQSGAESNALSHLKGYDLVVCGPVTSFEDGLSFKSQGSMLTFKMTNISSDFGSPTSLTINIIGGSNDVFKTNYDAAADTASYTLALSEYSSSTTSLVAYVMVPPFSVPDGASMAILLESASNKLRYVNTYTSEKDYVAATRYNFSITDFTGFDIFTKPMDLLNPYNTADSTWRQEYKPTTGDGSEDNPYLIQNAWNLGWLKSIILCDPQYNTINTHYKLTTNIYIQNDISWKVFGFSGAPFKGNFDGDGNEIMNLNIDSLSSHVGFFGGLDSASVSNLTIRGNITSTSSQSYFGGIAGGANAATITNCNSYVTVKNPGGGSTAGIVGAATGSTVIENCNSYNDIIGLTYTGGIVGKFDTPADGSLITNCNNYGDITGTGNYIGGIIGHANGSNIYITYCTNYADVTGSSTSQIIGGIVGEGYASALTNNTNHGVIIGSEYLVGTIIGKNDGGTLSDTNTNTGTANGESDQPIGSGY